MRVASLGVLMAVTRQGWLSLFTLHAIWPIVFIWAVSHKKQLHPLPAPSAHGGPDGDQARRFAELEARLRTLEAAK